MQREMCVTGHVFVHMNSKVNGNAALGPKRKRFTVLFIATKGIVHFGDLKTDSNVEKINVSIINKR